MRYILIVLFCLTSSVALAHDLAEKSDIDALGDRLESALEAATQKILDQLGQSPPIEPPVEPPVEPPIEPPVDPPVEPPLPPSGNWNVSMIQSMEPHTWLAYGDPWEDLNPNRSRHFCGARFTAIMGAWTSGAVDDDGNLWIVAAGGHADGCDQSTYKYNIEEGRAEVAIEHIPHTDKPDDGDWTTREQMSDEVAQAVAASDTLDFGGFRSDDVSSGAWLRQPRSTHGYNNLLLIGDDIYMSGHSGFPTGQQRHADNWLVNRDSPSYVRATDDVSKDIGRLVYLPDVPSETGVPGTVVSVAGWSFCEHDILTGESVNCDSSSQWWFGRSADVLYGATDTIWAHLSKNSGDFLLKIQKVDGRWTEIDRADVPQGWDRSIPGACIVPTPQGEIPIYWGDDDQLLAWKADGSTLLLSAPNGPGKKLRRKPYGKWGWSDGLQACVGADRTDSGVWVYKPDITQLTSPVDPTEPTPDEPPSVPTDPPPSTGEGETLFQDDFEDQDLIAELESGGYGDWLWKTSAGQTSDPNKTGPIVEDGVLKFIIASESDSNDGGHYQVNFIEGIEPFGPGDSLTVRFKWRASCEVIYTDCNPSSPDFKTERRCYAAVGGGCTAFKLAILGTGDSKEPNRFPANSCSLLETVLVHGADHALSGYHNCGWYAGFSEPVDPSSAPIPSPNYAFNRQPNGEFFCPSNFGSPEVRMTWGQIAPTCAQLDSDKWHDIEMTVHIGTWQADTFRTEPPDSQVIVKLDGQTVIDSLRYLARPETPEQGYGKLWLLPYKTSKDSTEVHPQGIIEYDDVEVVGLRG